MNQSHDLKMPALYIGHGAPPLLDDPIWSGQLKDLSGTIVQPKAILIVSAHWESANMDQVVILLMVKMT